MAGLTRKTALITGGAGFIGSHLAKHLKNEDFNVVIFDIAIDPKSFFVVNGIYKNTTFELVDVRDRKLVNESINKYSPDYIFHLAAEPIVERAFDNPYSAFETNIMGTVNVLEASRSLKKIKKIIVASSDKAYGKTTKAYTEESPLRGDHPYDVSKSAADLIAQTYFTTYGLPIVITRFGNVYGEGDTHINRIIPGICEAIIKKKVLEIRSNGKYIRDYLYVKDVVDGYAMLMDTSSAILGQAFNFSSKESLSVLQLVKKAEKILGVKIPFKVLNIAQNEIPYQHLNDAKVHKLGWANKFHIEKMLPYVLDWYREIL